MKIINVFILEELRNRTQRIQFSCSQFSCVFQSVKYKVSCSSFPSSKRKKELKKDYCNYILHVQLTLSFPLCLPVSFASFLQPSSNTIFKYHHQTFNVHPTNCNSLLSPARYLKKNIPRSIGYFAEGGESPIK